MQFTQDDLKQIEKWLIENSIKDSLFDDLNNPSNNDTVVIVHNGLNYKIPISALITLGIQNVEFLDLPTNSKTIIESIKELVVASGSFPEAPIDGSIYGREDGDWKKIEDSEIFKDMKNKVESLLSANFKYDFTASSTVIFQGSNTAITLKATSSDNSNIELFRETSSLISKTNVSEVTYNNVRVSNNTTFKATFDYNGTSYSKSINITAVNPIFYGSSSPTGYVFEELSKTTSAVTTPKGRYENINVRHDGDRVYFLVPSSMTINKVTLNGFNFPMDEPINKTIEIDTTNGKIEVPYKVYVSSNVYEITNLILEVS